MINSLSRTLLTLTLGGMLSLSRLAIAQTPIPEKPASGSQAKPMHSTAPDHTARSLSGKRGAERGLGNGLARMAQTLNLTEAQKGQIKTLLADQQTKIKALKSDTKLSEPDRKTRLKAMRKETMTRFMALLTPEQKQKLVEARKKGMARAGNLKTKGSQKPDKRG